MQGEQLFNGVEAAFWLLLSLLAATIGHRAAGITKKRQIALTCFLFAFGLSDVWEIYSGAWWRPASLLALKATCFTGLIITAALIYGARWRRLAQQKGAPDSRPGAPQS